MLTGTVLYYLPGTPGIDGKRTHDMDHDVSAEYARCASTDDFRTVEWSCSNGDPRDVRYFQRGMEVTDAVRGARAAYARAVARNELIELTHPFPIPGGEYARVVPAEDGRVVVNIGGAEREYAPADMMPSASCSALVIEAWQVMRNRAARVIRAHVAAGYG